MANWINLNKKQFLTVADMNSINNNFIYLKEYLETFGFFIDELADVSVNYNISPADIQGKFNSVEQNIKTIENMLNNRLRINTNNFKNFVWPKTPTNIKLEVWRWIDWLNEVKNIMSQWQLDIQEGESLHFENCKGGYFSADDEYGLKVVGKTRQALSGKNLFDISQVVSNPPYMINDGNGNLIVTSSSETSCISTGKTLAELCPKLQVGDVCMLSFDYTVFGRDYIYLSGIDALWYYSETPLTITQETLNSTVWFYGNYPDLTSASVISNIQIELGTIITDYEPYCGGEAAPIQCVKQGSKVIYRGKNLVPFPYTYGTQTINGVTFEVQEDGSIIVNGTATADSTYMVLERYDASLILPAGTYTLSGCPNGGGNSTYYIQKYIDGVYGDVDGGQGHTFDLAENKNPIIQVYLRVFKGNTVENLVFKPQIERGNKKTEYEKYNACEITTPCNLYEDDVWYPISGKVYRQNGMVEEYEPQPIFAQQGTVNIMQEPIELKADLSATMLVRKVN